MHIHIVYTHTHICTKKTNGQAEHRVLYAVSLAATFYLYMCIYNTEYMFICLHLYLISESVDREGKTVEDTGIVLDNTEEFFFPN